MTPRRIVTDCARGYVGSAVQMRAPTNVMSSSRGPRDADAPRRAPFCATRCAKSVADCCANASKGCGELDMVSCVRLVLAARSWEGRMLRARTAHRTDSSRRVCARLERRSERNSDFGEHHAIVSLELARSAHAFVAHRTSRIGRTRWMWPVAQAAPAGASRVNRCVVFTERACGNRRLHDGNRVFRSEDRPDFLAGVRAASEDRRPQSRSIEVAHFNKRRRSDRA